MQLEGLPAMTWKSSCLISMQPERTAEPGRDETYPCEMRGRRRRQFRSAHHAPGLWENQHSTCQTLSDGDVL